MTSSPTRRPLPPHLKLENPVIDFNALPADAAWWNVDAVLAEPAGEQIIELTERMLGCVF